MRNIKKEKREENKMGKITFENFGRKTKAKGKTIKKLTPKQQKFVEKLINKNDQYIVESPQNFDRRAAYIYITETREDQHYVIRVSENGSIGGTVDGDTDNEATLLKYLGGKNIEVRFCKLADFEPVRGGKA